MNTPTLTTRPCLLAAALVHDGPCTCLGSRDGFPAYFPTGDHR